MGKIQPQTSPDSNHQPQTIWGVPYAPVSVAQHGFSMRIIASYHISLLMGFELDVFKDVSTPYKLIICEFGKIAKYNSFSQLGYVGLL